MLLGEQNAKQSLAIADRGYLPENGGITGENDAQSMLSDPAVQAAYLGGAAATPAKSSAASSATAAVPKPTYVRPHPASGSARKADDLAGEAISGLVRRASERATPPATLVAPATPATKQPSGTAPDAGEPVARDPEVARLLKEIEDAAERARGSATKASAARPQTNTEPEAPLPAIKVRRRKPVEIWKRGRDGKLRKEE